MAQIVTITNPLTGQPAQVDQLDHTAQQIDDAITRALPGGAIDIALANKAEKKKIWTDLSSAGWYRAAFMSGSSNGDATSYIISISENYANFPPHSTVFMLSIGAVGATSIRASLTKIGNPTEIGSGYSVDKVRFVAGDNVIGGYLDIHYNRSGLSGIGVSIIPVDYLYTLNMLDFTSASDTVSEYTVYGYADEWVTPPMLLGVEYRTTERYLGKPVYVKVIDFGSLPNSTYKEVAHGVSNFQKGVQAYGEASGLVIPTNNFSGGMASGSGTVSIRLDGSSVVIATNFDASAYSARVTIKYTKKTD